MSVNDHEISCGIAYDVPYLSCNKYNKKVRYESGIEIINEGIFGPQTGSIFIVPKSEIDDLIFDLIRVSYENKMLDNHDLLMLIKDINDLMEEE